MAIRVTAIRLYSGSTHEHISRLWWVNPSTGAVGNNTRAEVVAYIDDDNGKVFVEDPRGMRVDVSVVKPKYGAKYLRTSADGMWTNNLLSLPQK